MCVALGLFLSFSLSLSIYHIYDFLRAFCRPLVQDPLDPASLVLEATPEASAINLARYTPIRVLGSGANGLVILVERVSDKQRFAAKIVPVSKIPVPPSLVYKVSGYR